MFGNECQSRRRRLALTDKDYANFTLRLEYLTDPGVNTSSGVMFRLAPTDPSFLPIKLMNDPFRGKWEIDKGEVTGTWGAGAPTKS